MLSSSSFFAFSSSDIVCPGWFTFLFNRNTPIAAIGTPIHAPTIVKEISKPITIKIKPKFSFNSILLSTPLVFL